AERRLVDHLRPLIIRSREQSDAFERVVLQWGVSAPGMETLSSGAAEAMKAAAQPTSVLPKPTRSFPIPIPWIVGALAVLFLFFWGLTRLTEPAPVTTTPSISSGVSAASQAGSSEAPTVVDAPETPNRQQSAEASDANILEGENLEIVLAYHLTQYDFAPTLRELHSTRFFGDIPLEELRQRTGFEVDRPLPVNESVLMRIFAAAFLRGPAPEDIWENLTRPNSVVDDSWPLSAEDRVNAVSVLTSVEPELYEFLGLTPATDRMISKASDATGAFEAIQGLARAYSPPREFIAGDVGEVAALTHDGSRIAIAPNENQIDIRDIETSNLTSTIETPVTRNLVLEFSRDDRLLFHVGFNAAAVLNVATGREMFSWRTNADNPLIIYAAFSEIADRVVIVSVQAGSETHRMRLWSLSDGQEIAFQDDEGGEIIFAEFSPRGDEFLTLTDDGSIQFWNAETGELKETWEGQSERGYPAYSSDGDRILGGNSGDALVVVSRETREPLSNFDPSVGPDGSTGFRFSPDGSRVLTSTDDAALDIWDTQTGKQIAYFSEFGRDLSWADFSVDESKLYTIDINQNLRVADELPPNAWPLNQDRIWTTQALAKATRDQLQEQFQTTLPESVTDAQVVRQVAALAYQRGETLLLRDPPWGGEPLAGLHEAPILQRHAPLFAALTFALIGIGIWLWSAFNMRAYLQRRRPGDPGRVIELFSDTRHQADKVQNAIRRAAKALLQRQPGHERLDIKASIKATAKARGLFTPVEKRDTRMPEYIFLIDARSRADHETQRTLDYLDRLRKEHVPITHYFYERAPDRVRASMGAPSQSLDLIASEHSDKRLVLVGDAASMYASNRTGSGAWKKTLESWQSKSFVTTVPVDEWGIEEEKFTQETGLNTNVLSAEGLEALPASLFADVNGTGVPTAPVGALDVPPLPSLMRRDPERWVIESAPDEDEWLELQSALVGYLSIPGWRWLCACAVYPVIEWDLTVALGQVLTGADDDPLFSESLAARLSELPWMRAGEMPDWLRSRLIDEIDHLDREAVRELIAKILEAVDSEQKTGGDTISLKFGYLQGREPDSDERFVDFVTRAPESMDENALLATRKLRELLRPNILKRLIDPGALGWAVIGLIAAGIAWLIAPRYIGAPSHTGAWAPLVAMLVGPLLAWFAWRGGRRVWRNRPRDASGVAAFPEKALLWGMTFLGLTGLAARWIDARGRTSLPGTAKLMRRRVEVWTMVPMLFFSVVVITLAGLLVGLMWRGLYALNDGWLTAVRSSLIGEIVLSALLIAGLYIAARVVWRGLRRLYDVCVRIADRASLQRYDLSHQPGGRISRTVFVFSAVYAVMGLTAGAEQLIRQAIRLFFDAAIFSYPTNTAILVSFLIVLFAIPAWHIWTLRRFANALVRLEQGKTTAVPGPELKAAA
ncbi:MAG: hypothetical protein AAGL11_05610, partial [Pseudomonadota bacterium]